jgi:hypothetical protein
LQDGAGMDARQFDHLTARAADPRLIPGIYNYCDSRCPRCPFTGRCLTYLDNRELTEQAGESVADASGGALRRAAGIVVGIARREGVDPAALAAEAAARMSRANLDGYRQDPLSARAEEYSHLAWRVSRAVAPAVSARGEASTIEAVAAIGWFSTRVSSKIRRAVVGQAEGWDAEGEVQTDFNGSAKMALLGIAESRRAWGVLMEPGKAAANGVPAQAVAMLDALDAAVRSRFPNAMAFVRPGFDEPPDVASIQGRS